MLIAPTEPPVLRALGKVSSTPEKLGADYLIHSATFGTVGVQRKEIRDLIASVHDGRLAKELQQMKALGLGVLLIEGNVQWTNDGEILGSYSRWTRAQHLGLLWSTQLAGYWIANTGSVTETAAWLLRFGQWNEKERHAGFRNRPGPATVWGKANSRDWALHFLQGFQGVGPETAAAIYDAYEGVPLQWTVSEMELRTVKGVGKGRAKSLIDALEHAMVTWGDDNGDMGTEEENG